MVKTRHQKLSRNRIATGGRFVRPRKKVWVEREVKDKKKKAVE
jgi:hypothetical protein